MKKTLKALVVIAVMLVMLVALTGCGNKIVATRESEQSGIKYEEKVEISLKKKKIDKVKMTMKFEDKDTAEKMKQQLDGLMSMASALGGGDMGLNIEQKGKEVMMELDAATFSSMADVDVTETELSKDDIKALKESLKEEGYKVK